MWLVFGLGLLADLALTVVAMWSLAPVLLLCLHSRRELAHFALAHVDSRVPASAQSALDHPTRQKLEALREQERGFSGTLGDEWASAVLTFHRGWLADLTDRSRNRATDLGRGLLDDAIADLARRCEAPNEATVIWGATSWIRRAVARIAVRGVAALALPAGRQAFARLGAAATSGTVAGLLIATLGAAGSSIARLTAVDLGSWLALGATYGAGAGLFVGLVSLLRTLLAFATSQSASRLGPDLTLTAAWTSIGLLALTLLATARADLKPFRPPPSSADPAAVGSPQPPGWAALALGAALFAVLLYFAVSAARDRTSSTSTRAVSLGFAGMLICFAAASLVVLALGGGAPPEHGWAVSLLIALMLAAAASLLLGIVASVALALVPWLASRVRRHGQPELLTTYGVTVVWVTIWVVAAPIVTIATALVSALVGNLLKLSGSGPLAATNTSIVLVTVACVVGARRHLRRNDRLRAEATLRPPRRP